MGHRSRPAGGLQLRTRTGHDVLDRRSDPQRDLAPAWPQLAKFLAP